MAWGSRSSAKSYLVKRVVDGDTIELEDGIKVRYLGVDAPELGQGLGKLGQCYGEEAKKTNEELVLGKRVVLAFEKDKYDNFGRSLAWVFLNNRHVGQQLVERGAARFYWTGEKKRYDTTLIQAEETARLKKSGLWSQCGPCLVKGNLDRNDRRYYHLPGSRYYEKTVVNLEHGDRWFCSPLEATRNGFKKALD